MKYFKKLVGKKCYLSPLNLEDAPQYSEWLSNIEIGLSLEIFHTQLSVRKEEQILQQMIDRNEYIFAIVDLTTDTLIGNCGLHNVHHINGLAEFGIFLGNNEYIGKGYAKEATSLILDFGFNILNLHAIHLRVYEFNTRARKLYESVGFKKTGMFRQAKAIGKKRYDVLIMDILADEYQSVYVQDRISTLT